MKRIAVVLVALVACGGQQSETAPPKPKAPSVECPICPMCPGRTEPAFAETAVGERFRLQTKMQHDAAGALRELGVRDESFEEIARQLYAAWRMKNPNSTVPSPVPHPIDRVTTSAPVYTPPPAPSSSAGWWCFSQGVDWSECSTAKQECDDRRAVMGGFSKCDKWKEGAFRSEPSYYNNCIRDEAADSGVSECETHERVACFKIHRILKNDQVDLCSSTIRACKAVRAFMAKGAKDDVRIKTECRGAD